ncbi:MAG: hypothetical protein WCO63_01190 [Bacteroidota bacterium]
MKPKSKHGIELIKYLKSVMPMNAYMHLHEGLKISRTWQSRIINHPEKMTLKMIQNLCKVVNNPEVTVKFLVKNFNCGYNVITKSEYDSIMKP